MFFREKTVEGVVTSGLLADTDHLSTEFLLPGVSAPLPGLPRMGLGRHSSVLKFYVKWNHVHIFLESMSIALVSLSQGP